MDALTLVIDKSRLPKHIAIILDGNGRWAKLQNKSRSAGHREGTNNVLDIVEYCDEIGVEYLTLYAFSTENWKRPENEVKFLMELLSIYLKDKLNRIVERNIKLRIIGDYHQMPGPIVKAIDNALLKTSHNTGINLNIALNYGGRAEIVRAAQLIAADIIENRIIMEQIDENRFSDYLYTKDQPDPDLLIRPGGELRISNFLIYQLAYAEFYFTEVLWPDFNTAELDRAILAYQKRSRRYGGLR